MFSRFQGEHTRDLVNYIAFQDTVSYYSVKYARMLITCTVGCVVK